MAECDREASVMRRPKPTKGLLCHGEKKILTIGGLFEDGQSSSGMVVCILEKVNCDRVIDVSNVGMPFQLM